MDMARKQISTLGRRIRELRERRGLTQVALGRAARVHRQVIARLETGERSDARGETIAEIAIALGVTQDELTGTARIAPMEPIVDAYLESGWARLDKPTSTEISWLRSQPAVTWCGPTPPSEESVHELLSWARRWGRGSK